MAETSDNTEPWFLQAKCPVFWPVDEILTLPSEEFLPRLAKTLGESDIYGAYPPDLSDKTSRQPADDDAMTWTVAGDDKTTVTPSESGNDIAFSDIGSEGVPEKPYGKFINALRDESTPDPTTEGTSTENLMRTENNDVAFRSTESALVDLFYELEDSISGPRLLELLNAAWKEDAQLTLKIIFNARSIHLGKSSRIVFYRCAGWLGSFHPMTLVQNLPWLCRPVIEKKAKKEDDGELVEMDVDEELRDDDDPLARHDVRHGVSHGYWKDLLNILALSANDKFNTLSNPRDILNTERDDAKHRKNPRSKEERKAIRESRHKIALFAYQARTVHRVLHVAIARLFADQLRTDIELLKSDDPKLMKQISLCAKWAPSTDRFHDRHTFIVSSIAEILYPEQSLALPVRLHKIRLSEQDEKDRRSVYLRYAREAYRKDVAALRKHIDIVERNLTTGAFDAIKYDRVPSLAMNLYSKTFERKDPERFENYIDRVAAGKTKISGAVLLPSVMVNAERQGKNKSKIAEKVADGQWKTLVNRIKESGKMESSIAVCDVSGSMNHPVFADGTTPMDSAIGLSLLVAEVTKPPFGGAFITFSDSPTLEEIDLSMTLQKKVHHLENSNWGFNTDFVAVFKNLILPRAVEHDLAPEDMVKRVFVFSDMQFDQADSSSEDHATSFALVKKAFEDAGYQMPELVFWNLAGGRAGLLGKETGGDPVAPKPVTADVEGVSLVSGYSQAMLKIFLDKGLDGAEDEEDTIVDQDVAEEGEDGEGMVDIQKQPPAKKQKVDPLSTVKKAVADKAYDMLRVVD